MNNQVSWFVTGSKDLLEHYQIPDIDNLTYPVLLILANNMAIVFDRVSFTDIVKGFNDIVEGQHGE